MLEKRVNSIFKLREKAIKNDLLNRLKEFKRMIEDKHPGDEIVYLTPEELDNLNCISKNEIRTFKELINPAVRKLGNRYQVLLFLYDDVLKDIENLLNLELSEKDILYCVVWHIDSRIEEIMDLKNRPSEFIEGLPNIIIDTAREFLINDLKKLWR